MKRMQASARSGAMRLGLAITLTAGLVLGGLGSTLCPSTKAGACTMHAPKVARASQPAQDHACCKPGARKAPTTALKSSSCKCQLSASDREPVRLRTILPHAAEQVDAALPGPPDAAPAQPQITKVRLYFAADSSPPSAPPQLHLGRAPPAA